MSELHAGRSVGAVEGGGCPFRSSPGCCAFGIMLRSRDTRPPEYGGEETGSVNVTVAGDPS